MTDATPTEAAEHDLTEFFTEPATDLDDSDAAIGTRIREARLAIGDSVDTVAARIGVEADTFASWEAGSVPLRANHLSRVAGLLSVSLSWLMIGRGPEPTGNHSELSRLRADLASARSRLDDVVNELAVLDQRLADIDDT